MSDLIPPNIDDRILESFRALVRAEIVSQRLNLSGHFDYEIVAVNGEAPKVTIDCNPADGSLGLPALKDIPVQPDIGGITSVPPTGIHCVVTFLNRDPTFPRIVGVDALGPNPIARLGDQVTMFLPPLTPLIGTDLILGAVVGVTTIASTITGTIVQGSGRVYTG